MEMSNIYYIGVPHSGQKIKCTMEMSNIYYIDIQSDES